MPCPAMVTCSRERTCFPASSPDRSHLRSPRRGAAYSPALMDFVIMTRKNSYMFLDGGRKSSRPSPAARRP